MKSINISQTPNLINQQVKLWGWLHNIREMGSIIFLDLRDESGIIQTIVDPKNIDQENFEQTKRLKKESVIEIIGQIKKRPTKNENQKILTGQIELWAEEIKIINPCQDLPFGIRGDTRKINEEIRLKYRYLDLRSDRMKNNLLKRHELVLFLRNYLSTQGFLEITTPLLGKGTPEGAREFIIPSRLHPEKFYTLPQSPQQYKQLLMVAGIEKYFQFAQCFRDEDQRADRQPEFTQLDLEMSFINEKKIMDLIEKMLVAAIKKIFPQKKVKTPFIKIPFQKSLKEYNSDKPDLRNKKDKDELSFVWIIDPPLFEYSASEKKLVSVHNPFTAPKEINLAKLKKEPTKNIGRSYDLVLNGVEIAGGAIRIHQAELQKEVFAILGLTKKEIEEKFSHLLQAMKFGAPPCGGIAFGFDRFLSILQNEENIREVIAFPKTGDAQDLLFGAPSKLPEKQLKEAHVSIRKD